MKICLRSSEQRKQMQRMSFILMHTYLNKKFEYEQIYHYELGED